MTSDVPKKTKTEIGHVTMNIQEACVIIAEPMLIYNI